MKLQICAEMPGAKGTLLFHGILWALFIVAQASDMSGYYVNHHLASLDKWMEDAPANVNLICMVEHAQTSARLFAETVGQSDDVSLAYLDCASDASYAAVAFEVCAVENQGRSVGLHEMQMEFARNVESISDNLTRGCVEDMYSVSAIPSCFLLTLIFRLLMRNLFTACSWLRCTSFCCRQPVSQEVMDND